MSESIFRKDGTAQGVAKQRLIESIAKPNKRVIYDPYAERFVVGSSIIKFMGHKLNVWLTKLLAPGFHEHLIARTRFIDDLVEVSTAGGIEQYVILGAGYDLRAHRLSLPQEVKIFEVDQPEVQQRKLSKLPENTHNSENITYVSVNFNHQSLKNQLLNSGFDLGKSAIFTLEGVSQYISKTSVNSTLKEIAELTKDSDAIFFMSYVNENLRDHPENCFGKGYKNPRKKAKIVQNLSAKVGEPWISFYTPEEIDLILTQNGFNMDHTKTIADLNSSYFDPVGRALPEESIFKLEHFMVAKSKR